MICQFVERRGPFEPRVLKTINHSWGTAGLARATQRVDADCRNLGRLP